MNRGGGGGAGKGKEGEERGGRIAEVGPGENL